MNHLMYHGNKLIRRTYRIIAMLVLLPVVIVVGSYVGIKEVFEETLDSVKKGW